MSKSRLSKNEVLIELYRIYNEDNKHALGQCDYCPDEETYHAIKAIEKAWSLSTYPADPSKGS